MRAVRFLLNHRKTLRSKRRNRHHVCARRRRAARQRRHRPRSRSG